MRMTTEINGAVPVSAGSAAFEPGAKPERKESLEILREASLKERKASRKKGWAASVGLFGAFWGLAAAVAPPVVLESEMLVSIMLALMPATSVAAVAWAFGTHYLRHVDRAVRAGKVALWAMAPSALILAGAVLTEDPETQALALMASLLAAGASSGLATLLWNVWRPRMLARERAENLSEIQGKEQEGAREELALWGEEFPEVDAFLRATAREGRLPIQGEYLAIRAWAGSRMAKKRKEKSEEAWRRLADAGVSGAEREESKGFGQRKIRGC